MDSENFIKISDKYVIVNSIDDIEYLWFELTDELNIKENQYLYMEKYDMGYFSNTFKKFSKSQLLMVDLVLKECIIDNCNNIAEYNYNYYSRPAYCVKHKNNKMNIKSELICIIL